jgi:hypothetical protein
MATSQGSCNTTFWGEGLLQVDTVTAERYSPHQITRHNSKVQAPAPKATTRMAKRVSNTAPKMFMFSGSNQNTFVLTHTLCKSQE